MILCQKIKTFFRKKILDFFEENSRASRGSITENEFNTAQFDDSPVPKNETFKKFSKKFGQFGVILQNGPIWDHFEKWTILSPKNMFHI